MATISTTLNRSSHIYSPGDELLAHVKISSSGVTSCKHIHVRLQQRAHGSGAPSVNVIDERTLSSDDIATGTHEYNVSFKLPSGPYSYQGTHTNLTWEVEAYIERGMGRDIQQSTPFVLQRDASAPVVMPTTILTQAETPYHKHTRKILLFALFIALPLFLLSIAILFKTGTKGLGCFFISGLTLLISGGMSLHHQMTSNVIKNATVKISPWPATTGNQAHYTLSFEAGVDLDIQAISATLQAKEIALTSPNDASVTHQHVVHEEVVPLSPAISLKKGQHHTIEHTFNIPEGAPNSFELWLNRLQWHIITTIDIPNWPDWNNVHVIHVVQDQ